MTVVILIIIICALVLWVLDLWTSRNDARTERDFYREARDAAVATMERQRKDNQRVLTAVAPLMEQTDWMTGRWNGQFTTLKRMEEERNEKVRALRHVYFDHVDIAAHIEATPIEQLIPGSVTL